MYKNKVFLLVISVIVFSQFSTSQNNTNSPYTRFGYGDISDNNTGEQRAMGGVSIGSRSHFSINNVNPASYSIVDSMTFMFDIGSSALISRFSDGNKTKSTTNANLEYINMQFPLSKTVGFSAGLLPYSFAGYNFYTTGSDSIPTINSTSEKISYTKYYNGTGGFSQVYTGLSANLFNHVSLGINAYYMFGSLNHYKSTSFDNSTTITGSTQINSIVASKFRFRYGAQFYNTFAKKHDVTLGLIFEPKVKLNGDYSQITTGVTTDTTANAYSSSDFELPMMFGVGLYYTYDKKISIGLDYSLQDWKNAKYYAKTESLSNRSKLAVGLEFIPNPIGRKFSDRVRYRAGFNMSDAYYKIDGNMPNKNFGITFGLGLPLRNSNTVINATVEYGKIGGVSQLNEDYLKFTFNAIFNEHWFFKRKL
jgi:hypothetical protein